MTMYPEDAENTYPQDAECVYPQDAEASAAPDDELVLGLVAGSFDAVRMDRPVERITSRGTALRRRRAALPAAAVTVVAALLSVAATLPLRGAGAGAAAAPLSASASASAPVGVAVSGTAASAVTPLRADPGYYRISISPGGTFTVDLTALGDAARLNATFQSLGIKVDVIEEGPLEGLTGSRPCSPQGASAEPGSDAEPESGARTMADSAAALPSLRFTLPGTGAEFLVGDLPAASLIRFSYDDGGYQRGMVVFVDAACVAKVVPAQ